MAAAAPARLFLISSFVRLIALIFISPVLAYTQSSDEYLKGLKVNEADFDIHNGGLLAPLLIPRVSGTEGQVKAQRHFVDFFRSELPKWSLTWQNSTDKTPATGDRQIPFQNIIVRREPPWAKPGQTNYFTLVAHYDSKYSPEGFIGATDSAAPCAMMMYAAREIDARMTEIYDKLAAQGETGGTPAKDMGIQLIFLDGEEAFVSWTDTDSLYGSRSMAAEWEKTLNPAMSSYKNPLDQISIFVLLDLLGASNPRIPSYFQTTHWAYQELARVEKRLRDLGLLESTPRSAFLPDLDTEAKDLPFIGIGDDHQPFMFRGVDILHLITSPFPQVWHTMDDDGEHLDMPTVRDWTKIFTAFTYEWMDLAAQS